jgi:hypothetical protein
VELTPAPDTGSTFDGWVGACTGAGTCSVTDSVADSVTATFRTPGSPEGWTQGPIPPPSGVDPYPTNSSSGFFDVALSGDGTVRAEDVFHLPPAVEGLVHCSYDSTETGGIYLQRRNGSQWIDDGTVTAPSIYGTGESAQNPGGSRWTNCNSFGQVSKLSADGSTLLLSQPPAGVVVGQSLVWRCATFVYRHGNSGWTLDGTLFPPGVGPDGSGSTDAAPCHSFGIGAGISQDGSRVAVIGATAANLTVDVFVRGNGGWSPEQHIDTPAGTGCAGSVGAYYLALSRDASTMLVGDPDCTIDNQDGVGRVYAYDRSGSNWSLTQTIDSPEPQFQNFFGSALALSADARTATIGVVQSTGVTPTAGASWVYERTDSGWTPMVKLHAPSPEQYSGFRCLGIPLNGARLVCTAYDTVGYDTRQGSLYVFDSTGVDWSGGETMAHAFATDGLPQDTLGATPVAVPDDSAFIDTTIAGVNIGADHYAHDRIGYEFVPPPSTAPSIASLTPGSGWLGRLVTIDGTNLGSASVAFNGTAATITSDSADEIVTSVPCGATSGDVTVTTAGGVTRGPATFTITAGPSPPTVSKVSRSSGKTGTSVKITGSGMTGASVRFGCTPATAVSKSTSVTAKVPALGATSIAVPIRVTTATGTTVAATFTYLAPPTVTSLAPGHGPAGTPVTVTGTDLDGVTSVKFGKKAAKFTPIDGQHVSAVVPTKAKTAPVTVTTPAGTATSPTSFGVP